MLSIQVSLASLSTHLLNTLNIAKVDALNKGSLFIVSLLSESAYLALALIKSNGMLERARLQVLPIFHRLSNNFIVSETSS